MFYSWKCPDKEDTPYFCKHKIFLITAKSSCAKDRRGSHDWDQNDSLETIDSVFRVEEVSWSIQRSASSFKRHEEMFNEYKSKGWIYLHIIMCIMNYSCLSLHVFQQILDVCIVSLKEKSSDGVWGWWNCCIMGRVTVKLMEECVSRASFITDSLFFFKTETVSDSKKVMKRRWDQLQRIIIVIKLHFHTNV